MSVPPTKKTGMSLYADLLKADKLNPAATVSGAPVMYDTKKADAEAAAAAKKKDASLKFQPIRRPQAQQKTKPKQSSGSLHKWSSSSTSATVPASSPDKQLLTGTPQQQQPKVQCTNFEDWVGDQDDDFYYQDRAKHERGGRKKKKKTKHGRETRVWDWDDIYDPTLPNNYADYKGSEEQYREIRDWKARLYYHQLKTTKDNKLDAAGRSDEEKSASRPANHMFPPPKNLSFAPPTFDNEVSHTPQPIKDDDSDDYYPPYAANNEQINDSRRKPTMSFAPPTEPVEITGEDAFTRRMQMSRTVIAEQPPAPQRLAPQVSAGSQVPSNLPIDVEAKKADAAAKVAAFKAKLAASRATSEVSSSGSVAALSIVPKHPLDFEKTQNPPAHSTPLAEESRAVISHAPVHYKLPRAQSNLSAGHDEDNTMGVDDRAASVDDAKEGPRSNRPGQKGFAERMLKKYGWEKGKGLGAQGEGITTAIVAKAEKRKMRSDAQGGGWAQPANMGKIVGGKRRKIENADDDDGKFGQMSEVVKLEGMLNGLDVEYEIQEKNLMQEIGDEMSNNYGTIERLFIWREEMGGQNEVFVKFTSQLSALRAVNATDGMTFAGNQVLARFFRAEKFEQGEYA